MNLFIVGLEKTGKWWCADRTPSNYGSHQEYYNKVALESAHNEANLLMMKYHPSRDMSQAKIVWTKGAFMPHIEAPEYFDKSYSRKTPIQVWVIPAPTRYQAVKIAKEDYNKKMLKEG